MLYDIGTVCVKLAGRDAGKTCVVVDIIDDNHVLIDGETRRRKCNASHLEPLKKTINVAKGADTKAIADAFKKELNIEIRTETKPKQAAPRPKKAHMQHEKKEAKKKAPAKAKAKPETKVTEPVKEKAKPEAVAAKTE